MSSSKTGIAWLALCLLAVMVLAPRCAGNPGGADGGECSPPCGLGSVCENGACVCRPGMCPGCCNEGQCVASSDRACGVNGVACATCSGLTPTCISGNCTSVCDPLMASACGTGCCASVGCVAGTQDDACGKGTACVSCAGNPNGRKCVADQTCGCNTEADCPQLYACVNQKCTKTCDNGHLCNGGCCSAATSGTCVAGNTLSQCGDGGTVCSACGSLTACNGGRCTSACRAGVACNGGCCSSATAGTCVGGTGPANCGRDGGVCVNCGTYACGTTGACFNTCSTNTQCSGTNFCCNDAGTPRCTTTCP